MEISRSSRLLVLLLLARVATAATPEDLGPEAQALQDIQEESVRREAGEPDGYPPPLNRSLRRAYFSAGTVIMKNLDKTGPGFSFAAGYGWDTARTLTKFQLQFAFNGMAYATDLTMAGHYFYDFGFMQPYLETDFGLGMAKADGGGSVGGPVVGGGLGIQILRFHTVAFDLGGRVGVLLWPSSLGLPILYSLRLGLYF